MNEKENEKKRIPKRKCKGCFALGYDKEIGHYCMAVLCDKEYDYDPDSRTWTPKYKPRTDSCMQRVYCNECLAYPMGLGCPNLEKIKKDRAIERQQNIKNRQRYDLNKIRTEIKRLKKWKSSLDVRYTYHCQKERMYKNG